MRIDIGDFSSPLLFGIGRIYYNRSLGRLYIGAKVMSTEVIVDLSNGSIFSLTDPFGHSMNAFVDVTDKYKVVPI